MLMKAAAAVKADKAKAIDMFNKGEGGFLDRDLYVFCGNISDGKAVAIGNPNAKQLLGRDARTLKDATGKAFGVELYAAYQKPEGQISEVSYMFPRPGADKTPVATRAVTPARAGSSSAARTSRKTTARAARAGGDAASATATAGAAVNGRARAGTPNCVRTTSSSRSPASLTSSTITRSFAPPAIWPVRTTSTCR